MEKNFFKEMPKFQSPEEELDFLRFHNGSVYNKRKKVQK